MSRLLSLWAALWAGMIIGLSLIATPVKFTAPTLERAAAFDVGRVTFELFNKVELGFAAMMILLVLVCGQSFLRWAVTLIIGAIVLAQAFWIGPVLYERALAIIAGETLPPTDHHQIYVAMEGVKIVLLVGAALGFVRKRRRR